MEDCNINNRIKEIIDTLYRGNAAEFSKDVDIHPSTISSIVGKRQNVPSFAILSKIYEGAYKHNVSAHWVLTGRGQMIEKKHYAEVNPEAINAIGGFFNKYGALSPEAKDTLIESLEEEIKELKKAIRNKDAVISKRDELINTLFGEMTKLVRGEK